MTVSTTPMADKSRLQNGFVSESFNILPGLHALYSESLYRIEVSQNRLPAGIISAHRLHSTSRIVISDFCPLDNTKEGGWGKVHVEFLQT